MIRFLRLSVGSFQDIMGTSDSKLNFCQAVVQLREDDIPDDAPAFWMDLFGTPVTVVEAFQFITPSDIRLIRTDKPANMAKLLATAVVLMKQAADGKQPFTLAQTVCRVITRIMPILLEHDTDGFIQSTMWPAASETQLGGELAQTLVRLLFVPDGTIYASTDPPSQTETGIEKTLLWMSTRAPRYAVLTRAIATHSLKHSCHTNSRPCTHTDRLNGRLTDSLACSLTHVHDHTGSLAA